MLSFVTFGISVFTCDNPFRSKPCRRCRLWSPSLLSNYFSSDTNRQTKRIPAIDRSIICRLDRCKIHFHRRNIPQRAHEGVITVDKVKGTLSKNDSKGVEYFNGWSRGKHRRNWTVDVVFLRRDNYLPEIIALTVTTPVTRSVSPYRKNSRLKKKTKKKMIRILFFVRLLGNANKKGSRIRFND